jgi:hypothetical protein
LPESRDIPMRLASLGTPHFCISCRSVIVGLCYVCHPWIESMEFCAGDIVRMTRGQLSTSSLRLSNAVTLLLGDAKI